SILKSGLRECPDKNGVIEFLTSKNKRTEATVGSLQINASHFRKLLSLKTVVLEPFNPNDGMKCRARRTARRSDLRRWIWMALTAPYFIRRSPALADKSLASSMIQSWSWAACRPII